MKEQWKQDSLNFHSPDLHSSLLNGENYSVTHSRTRTSLCKSGAHHFNEATDYNAGIVKGSSGIQLLTWLQKHARKVYILSFLKLICKQLQG